MVVAIKARRKGSAKQWSKVMVMMPQEEDLGKYFEWVVPMKAQAAAAAGLTNHLNSTAVAGPTPTRYLRKV